MKIRRATDEEMDEVLALDRVCFPYDAPPKIDGTWWVAANDTGDVCAYAAARPGIVDVGGVYLARAGVAPEARGHGLQRRLIRTRLRWAKRSGYVWAFTDTASAVSANNLIACGFRMYAPAHPWAFTYSTYWRRAL